MTYNYSHCFKNLEYEVCADSISAFINHPKSEVTVSVRLESMLEFDELLTEMAEVLTSIKNKMNIIFAKYNFQTNLFDTKIKEDGFFQYIVFSCSRSCTENEINMLMKNYKKNQKITITSLFGSSWSV